MLSNNKLKTISLSELKSNKTINIQTDTIISCLLKDLSEHTYNYYYIQDCHNSLDMNEIDKIIKLIEFIGQYLLVPNSSASVPEDIKPYFDAIKNLYLKSNLQLDFESLSQDSSINNDMINLF